MKKGLKRINREYRDFKNEALLFSKEKIFDMAYKINFYHEIWSFLNDTERKIKPKMSLADLYDFFLSKDYTSIASYTDIEELFDYYEEDMEVNNEM